MRISDWSSDVCSSDLSLDDEAAFGPAASAGQSGFGDVLQLAEAGGLDRDALAWRQRCQLLLFPVLCGNPHLAFQQCHGADAAFHAYLELGNGGGDEARGSVHDERAVGLIVVLNCENRPAPM